MSKGGKTTKGKTSSTSHDADAGYTQQVGENVNATLSAHKRAYDDIIDKQVAVLDNKNASSAQKATSVAIGVSETMMASIGAVAGAGTQLSEAVMMPIMEKLAGFKGTAILPVCKQMDPVMGIDVHMVCYPPVMAPIPLPHPYVGFSFRAKDFVACAMVSIMPTPDAPVAVNEESTSEEIDASNEQRTQAMAHAVASLAMGMLGATVKFGGLQPRTVAGTPTKNVIKHIALAPQFHPAFTAAIEKNHGHALLGSFFVVADGSPLTGAPVHLHNDCWDVGIPSIHSIKPNKNADESKPTRLRLYAPSGMFVPIPWTRPVITNPIPAPINPLTAPLRAFQAAFGKLKKAAKKKIDDNRKANEARIKKLKLPCAAKTMISKLLGTGQSHPVDVAAGYFYTDNEDFSLPGPIPLNWERTWYSYSEYQGPLGHGWHHSYDMAIGFDYEEGIATIRMNDGRGVDMEFPIDASKPTYSRNEKLRLFLHAEERYYYVKDKDELIYRFTDKEYAIKASSAKQHLLQSISNMNGFAIRFSYSADGCLEKIIDSGGRRLTVQSDDEGRIVAIYAPHPDKIDEQFSIARYRYSHEGDMIDHADALNQSMLFEYNNHLMVKEIWRNGLTWQFWFNGNDSKAKCIEVTGDDDLLHYKFDYSNPQCTLVTNSLGYVKSFYHRNGIVTKYIDPNAAAWQYRYNRFNELESTTDPLGNQYLFTYDEWGNIMSTTQPDGLFTQLGYFDPRHPNQLTEALDERGGKWLWEYDEAANLVKNTNPLGAAYVYEHTDGLLRKIVDPIGKETILEYDIDFNLSVVTPPNGSKTIYRYDGSGNCKEIQNPKGRLQIRKYDLLNRVIQLQDFDRNLIHLAYDAIDNIIQYSDDVKNVEFSYNGLWKLRRRSEGGTTIYFIYDTEEQLRKIVNEQGLPYTFKLDPTGKVISETAFDGLTKVYQRNAAGLVTRAYRAGNRITDYDYDEVGRITQVTYHNGTKEYYKYDRGRLHQAVNENATVIFERDIIGSIVKEICNGYEVHSSYNVLGDRTDIGSSLGAAITFNYDAMGDVVMQQAMGWKSETKRDVFGLEIEKILPGGIISKWERDNSGQIVAHWIEQQNIDHTVRTLKHRRRYKWGVNDLLKEIDDKEIGTTKFEHDERGNLTRTIFSNGIDQLRNPDAVGNLFKTPDRQDRKYDKGGRLLKSETATYSYDGEGFLITKQQKNGNEWRYQWNAAGMLEKVVRPDATEVLFKYDSLGRRIEKHYRKTITKWVWDGNKPLHEWKELNALESNPDDIITWVFEEDSFTLAGKIKGGKEYSILVDHLGTPNQIYNADGETIWEGYLDSYGKMRVEKGEVGSCPFRYQGQYEDIETGLYYNRFRYYAAEEGIYISQDPIDLYSGEFNFYRYVDDPNIWVDEFGLAKAYREVWEIKDPFPPGSKKSRQLRRFVKLWNEEIKKAGGLMQRRKPTKAEERASRRWKRQMRRKYPGRFEDKVVGHAPDAAAGGPSSGGTATALDSSVNSSVGGQVPAKPVGYTYTEVKVVR